MVVMPAHLVVREDTDPPSVTFDVGYVEDLGVLWGEILLAHVDFEIAEFATESDQPCFIKRLITIQ